jgi:putative thioredoxin
MSATTHAITDFQADVLDRSHTVPVLVDFWADWCGPCRMLGPVLEKLAAEADGRWVLAKVDTEAHPDLAQRFGIQGIPNCKLFVDGEVFDEFAGALPEPQLRRWLDDALPSTTAAALAGAEGLLAEGRFYEAALAAREVLAASPGDDAARVLLGRTLLRLDPEGVSEALAGIAEDSEHHDAAAALRTLAALALAGDHPEALPDGPARVHVLSAARCLRAGDWDGTLAALIDGMRAQRDGVGLTAREAGRAVYRLLGIRHPACDAHHRAFASALNV